jgi:hypothetical protein
MRIEAKVAAVIPPTDVAVNVGTDGGVKPGDTLVVYFSVTINDPDTHEELGGVEYRRGSYKVTAVGKRWAVASITDTVPSGNLFSAFQLATSGTRPSLKDVVDRGAIPASASDSTATSVKVGVGDPAYVLTAGSSEEEEEEEEEPEEPEGLDAMTPTPSA